MASNPSLPASSSSLPTTTSRSRALAERSPPSCARSSSTNAARSGVGGRSDTRRHDQPCAHQIKPTRRRSAGRLNGHRRPRALRTETTINDTRDFGLSKRLTNLAALRQIGFPANRRLLGVQRISHDPVRGAQAFLDLTAPLVGNDGTRIPGLHFGDVRVHALLQALLVHRLLPHGFTNRDLRILIAPLLGKTPEDITAGKMTYDLRRLRAHGLIQRIPKTRRYQVTDIGLQDALLFTHAHDHLLRTGLAELTDPSPPRPSPLRAAARAYQAALRRPGQLRTPGCLVPNPQPRNGDDPNAVLDSIMTAVPSKPSKCDPSQIRVEVLS